MTTQLWVSGLALLLAASACTKTQLTPDEGEIEMAANNPKNECNAIEFKDIFKKTYDSETGLLKSITSPGWSAGMIDQFFTYDVLWLPGKVIFHQGGGETNYALLVVLNEAGQVTETTVGNQPAAAFLNSEFTYSGNRLVKIEMEFAGGLQWNLKYDKKGNCILIDKINGGEEDGFVRYEYDLTKKGKNQYYEDEARGWSEDTYTLLLNAGLLPSVMPTNLRTRTTVYWNNGYQASDRKFSHHQLDRNKNLISYRAAPADGGSAYWTQQITWACPTKGMSLQ